MNVRQLHIFTPHWNYEKINQIIGRIRRVGSHDALPPEQRSVNIYLYMAYDPTIPCTNSINYSIDYVKYVISEEKYNQALKYNKALQNASIESLICRNSSNINSDKSTDNIENRNTLDTPDTPDTLDTLDTPDTLDTLHYSTQYLNKILPLYLSITCNELKIILNSCNYVSVQDLRNKIPILNSFIIDKIIDTIKSNNIIINENILEYSCGLFFLEMSSNVHFCNNINAYSSNINLINSSFDSFAHPSKLLVNDSESKIISDEYQNQTNVNSYKSITKEMENKILKFENLLDNNSIKEFYYGITQLSYTEILE
ncbi:hypothetical protein PIROE2DRAFT_15880, partial [Piromyces sp. E2]